MEAQPSTQEKRKKKGRRALFIGLGIVALVVLLVVGGVGYAVSRMNRGAAKVVSNNGEAVDAEAEALEALGSSEASETPATLEMKKVPIYEVAKKDPNVTNILLVGTDSRQTAGSQIAGNSDTIILASFNRKTNVVTLASFMRDTVVHAGSLDGPEDRLKTTYAYGGIGLLINTLNTFYELDIQGYVMIGLEGFITFIDNALDGLDVELSQDEIDYINRRIEGHENECEAVKKSPLVDAEPGLVHLNGAQTLVFARNRDTAADKSGGKGSDFDRVSRQQEVLKLIYKKIVAEKPLTAIPGLITFAMQHVETNLSANEIYDMAVPLMTEDIEITSCTVPFTDMWTSEEGTEALIIPMREENVRELSRRLYEQ